MQNVTTATQANAENYAAGGRKSSSVLGADFAAMLSGIGDAQNGMQGINGIFSAMKDLKNAQQNSNVASSNQKRNDQSKVSFLDNKNNLSTQNKANSKTSSTKKTNLDEDDEEELSTKSTKTDDSVTEWMASLLGNGEQEVKDTEATTTKNAASLELKSSVDPKLKQSTLKADGEQNLNTKSTKNSFFELNQEALALDDDQQNLAFLMAQGNVKNVSVTEQKGSQNSQLLAANADDLSFIDESLKAAASLDGENSYSSSNGQSSFANNGQNSGQQSVNAALATLRQNLNNEQLVEANETPQVMVTEEVTATNLSQVKGQSAHTAATVEFSEDLSGASQGLSDARRLQKSNESTSLRQEMLTLSNDAKKNAEEISKAVMSMAARNLKRFSFELNPHGLGRMEIAVDADENSKPVAVTVAAEDQGTRRMLQESMGSLKELLADQGVDADTSLGEFSSSSDNDQGSFAGSSEGFMGGQQQSNDKTLFAGSSNPSQKDEPDESKSVDDGLSLFA